MKIKRLLVVSLGLWSITCSAQHWQPLVKGYSYNYLISGNLAALYCMTIDSVKHLGNDTLWYPRRTNASCDDCLRKLFLNNPDARGFYLQNVPTFLQKEIKYHNRTYIFSIPEHFVLKPYESLNSSWTYDSIRGITATVMSVTHEAVFNEPDSVKVIVLSNSDSIVISKNHGILQFPKGYKTGLSFKLAGIDGRKLGLHIPSSSEFFNHKVGDQYQIKVDEDDCNGIRHYYDQFTIIDKKYAGTDSVTYTICGMRSNGSRLHGRIMEIDDYNSVINKPPYSFNNTTARSYAFPTWGYDYKAKGFTFQESYGGYAANPYNNTDTIVITRNPNSDGSEQSYYVEGLGLAYYSLDGLCGSSSQELTAYNTAKGSAGSLYAITTINCENTAINAPKIIDPFTLFPNPAINNSININYNLTASGYVSISISDSKGVNVYNKTVSEVSGAHADKLDIALPNGIYIVKLQSGDTTVVQKLVVQR